MSAETVGVAAGVSKGEVPVVSRARSRIRSAVVAGNAAEFEAAMQSEVGSQFARDQATNAPGFRVALKAMAKSGCALAQQLYNETEPRETKVSSRGLRALPKQGAASSAPRRSQSGPPRLGCGN